MEEIVIKAEGLSKSYNGRFAVKEVNMSVCRGDIYGFIGANGAGKTTFLRMVMGLVRPDAGKLELFGQSDPQSLIKNRARIGCIIETPSLYPNMTAYDCLKAQKLLTGSKKTDIDYLLNTVGLSGTGKKAVKNFSLGMKQRLAIAQCLVNDPEVLILDEPTNGMDPEGIVEIRNFLKGLAANGITILMSSHILSELEQLATRFGIINSGALIDEFSSSELQTRHVRSITIRVDDIPKSFDLLKKAYPPEAFMCFENGLIRITNELDFKAINIMLIKNDINVEVFEKETSDLEKYFISKVGAK